jgi:hypothetical protein
MERVWQRDYADHAEAIPDVTEYVEGPYNSVSMHSKLGHLSTNTYTLKVAAKQLFDVAMKFALLHARRDPRAQRGGGVGSPPMRRTSHGSTRPTSGRVPTCSGTDSARAGLARSAMAKLKL